MKKILLPFLLLGLLFTISCDDDDDDANTTSWTLTSASMTGYQLNAAGDTLANMTGTSSNVNSPVLRLNETTNATSASGSYVLNASGINTAIAPQPGPFNFSQDFEFNTLFVGDWSESNDVLSFASGPDFNIVSKTGSAMTLSLTASSPSDNPAGSTIYRTDVMNFTK